jgi:hypothetical protein
MCILCQVEGGGEPGCLRFVHTVKGGEKRAVRKKSKKNILRNFDGIFVEIREKNQK